MNQILYTGTNNTNSTKDYSKSKKTKMSIIVFSIIIALFGIGLIVTGGFLISKVDNGKNVAQNNPNKVQNGNKEEKPKEENKVSINFLSDEGKVLIDIKSKEEIKSVSYNWDNGEEKNIEIGENTKEIQHKVEIKSGTHDLYVTVTDITDKEFTATKQVIGASEPTVKISTDGVSKYVIKATDENKLSKMTITLNGEKTELNIDGTKYVYEIEIPEGDSSLKVTVENSNGKTAKKSAKISGFEK